jgi:hypothetical protein
MAIELERGPFRRFGGTWALLPLGAAGCRVDFELHYDFDRTPMALVARPVFDRIANALVDRFVARADAVCPGHREVVAAFDTVASEAPDESPPATPDPTEQRSSPP